jgi:site-specific DNA recombinase
MEAVTQPRAVAIYCRISQDRDGTALGVERQRADCERLAKDRGWPIAGTYVDNDISAYSGRKRPEYERLLADIKSGAIDAVVAWHPDRLHRSPLELEGFIDAVERTGTRVETVQAGHTDLSTPSGRAVARTLGAWARYESEHKAERIKRKHRELAEHGRAPRSGVRPFGYTRDWSALVPEEAELVREAVARVFAGESLRSICTDWNARGLVTTTGGRWQQSPLKRLLTAARNAGIRELVGYDNHKRRTTGDKVAPGDWPAIFDEATLDRLRAILRDPSRRTSMVNARSYLLSGYVHCGACGRPLKARPRSDKVRRYVCATGPMTQGCGKVAVVSDPLEREVVEQLLTVLPRSVTEPPSEPAVDDAEEAAALAADREALDRLHDDHYLGNVPRSKYLTLRDALVERIARREARRAAGTGRAVVAPLVGAGDIRRVWEQIGLDQRRAVIGWAIHRIVVAPVAAERRGSNRFDGSRVNIEWLR